MKQFFFLILFYLPLLSVFSQPQPVDPFIQADNVGGRRELKRIIRQEMVYPIASLEKGLGGKVVWLLVITKNGTPYYEKLLTSVNEELDNEALRIIKMLEFRPATYFGDPADSFLQVEVKFNPAKYQKICRKRGYEQPLPLHLPADTSFRIFDKVHVYPQFNMGNEQLESFLLKRMKFPSEAHKKNITGTVKVTFVVEPSGMITNIRISKPTGGGCNEEAYRLITLTRWTPGLINGTAVRTKITVPVGFYLKKPGVGESGGDMRQF
jgi:TonB family protein